MAFLKIYDYVFNLSDRLQTWSHCITTLEWWEEGEAWKRWNQRKQDKALNTISLKKPLKTN